MKIIAQFQFYLQYVLPRGDDWQNTGVAFSFPNFVVKVRPRNLEEELFPNEIDKTLSTMQLTLVRISLPTGSLSRIVKDTSFDRLEAIVEGEINSKEEMRNVEIQAAYREVAVRACNIFINHCRVVSQSLFMTGIEEHYRLQDRKYYVLIPHTISWFDGETGIGLPAYEGGVNAAAGSGAIQSPERGSVTMVSIQQSLSKGKDPNLIDSLLLDARERIVMLRFREAVLSICTACEVASNEYLSRKGRVNDAQVKKFLKKNVSFAEKRFDLLTNLISGKSLKVENAATFDLVEKVYRSRNNIAHEGRAIYEDGGSTIEVDAPIATEFLEAAENAVKWLANL